MTPEKVFIKGVTTFCLMLGILFAGVYTIVVDSGGSANFINLAFCYVIGVVILPTTGHKIAKSFVEIVGKEKFRE